MIPVKTIRAALIGLAVLATAPGVAPGQSVRSRSALWVGAPLDDYVRLLELTGEVPLASRMLRPLDSELRNLRLADSSALAKNPWRARYGARQNGDTSRFGVEVYDPIMRLTENTAVPYGTNDASLWAGRGLSGALDVGAAIRYGPLTIRVAPTITYSQNADLALGALQPRYINGVAVTSSIPADMSPYADPYMSYNIDLPQRFGDKSLKELNWGQSAVQLSGRGIRAGIGNENMWWGSGRENSILMTNNASGFAHAFAGTDRPVDIWIGKLEALYTVGKLKKSDFWRSAAPDSMTHRWMNALLFVFEPRGAPGLYLGAGRVFYSFVPAGGIDAGDLVEIFQPFTKVAFQNDTNPTGNDRTDQMLVSIVRWVMPASNFEVYAEFGRNDHPVERRDLVLEPDHATGYMIGFQKLFMQDAGFVRLGGETTHLVGGLTRLARAQPTWYAHYVVTPGFTQQGQVIGAGIGPGGEMASLRADRYRSWGNLGVFGQWQRVNTDVYFRHHVGQFQRHYHDVFMGAGGRAARTVGPVDLSAELVRLKEYNRYGIRRNDVVNYHGQVTIQVRMP